MRKRLLKGTATCALLCTTLAVLASCGGGVNNGELYTYNTYLSIAPSTWNTHNWETSEESYIQSFTEMGLYDVILNETKDGYTVVSEMAASYPTDALPTMSREEQQEANKPKYTLNESINLIRETIKKVEESGFKVDEEEMDLINNYQITIKISKENNQG